MAGLRMVLLRHAFSMGNARREFSGTADVPLAPQGEQMVRDYRARGVYEACAISERYFSSPLTRCLQTFHLALDGLATLDGTIDEFHEVEFGEMEGRVLERQQARAFFDAWVDGRAMAEFPHLESYAHLRDRGCRAVRRLARDMAAQGVGSVTVVTHSAISRALLAGMAGLPDRAWLDIDVPNALGYTLELAVDGDEVRMERAVPWGPDAAERPVIVPAR